MRPHVAFEVALSRWASGGSKDFRRDSSTFLLVWFCRAFYASRRHIFHSSFSSVVMRSSASDVLPHVVHFFILVPVVCCRGIRASSFILPPFRAAPSVTMHATAWLSALLVEVRLQFDDGPAHFPLEGHFGAQLAACSARACRWAENRTCPIVCMSV